jgi:hypothetical protein
LKQLLRPLLGAGLFAGAIALVLVLSEAIDALGDAVLARLGAGPTIALVGIAILALALTWVRYGGARVLRRWGVILKPARAEKCAPGTDAGSDPGRRPDLVGPSR